MPSFIQIIFLFPLDPCGEIKVTPVCEECVMAVSCSQNTTGGTVLRDIVGISSIECIRECYILNGHSIHYNAGSKYCIVYSSILPITLLDPASDWTFFKVFHSDMLAPLTQK